MAHSATYKHSSRGNRTAPETPVINRSLWGHILARMPLRGQERWTQASQGLCLSEQGCLSGRRENFGYTGATGTAEAPAVTVEPSRWAAFTATQRTPPPTLPSQMHQDEKVWLQGLGLIQQRPPCPASPPVQATTQRGCCLERVCLAGFVGVRGQGAPAGRPWRPGLQGEGN